MCGIAGKLNFDPEQPVSPGLIDAMLSETSHRGPDGVGTYFARSVGLGHRRLAIIDLQTGDQPLSNEDGTVWIVFNGEIYNYPELRERLLKAGHVFRSKTDTEVIVHLYEQYGVDCLRHLRGMFAFAIWDDKRQRLFLARDRVGIKPLYFGVTREALVFASELKAVLAEPAVSRELSANAVRNFLSFYYLPGEATLFSQIKRLLPGHYLVVEGGKTQVSRYWDLAFTDSRWSMPFEEAVEELRQILAASVKDHMIADVPVGVLLSGGMDSSAVLSFAVQETGKKISSFTVGFQDDGVVDERPYARLAAERFGTEHYDISITDEDFWNFLPRYVWHMEDPVCEPPAVALYYVSKLARQHVKVLLSGEGGDEAFAGYPNYVHMLRLERLRHRVGPFAKALGSAAVLGGRLLGDESLRRYGGALGRPLDEHYFSRTSGPRGYFGRQARRLFTPEFERASGSANPSAMLREMLHPAADWNLLSQMLYIDSKTWLPDDLLIKADKMTMANSLELRVPLLDHQVLEFAASLPAHYKVSGYQTKRIFKAALARVLPSEIVNRKKAGFPVPYTAWLRNGLAGRIRDVLLSGGARTREYFRPEAVETLLAADRATGNFGKEVFSLLVLEMWHQAYSAAPKASVNN